MLFVLWFMLNSLGECSEFDCDYLPNGCKFEETFRGFSDYKNEIFVCDSLDKSFDLNEQQMQKCKKNESSYTQVYFKLSSAETADFKPLRSKILSRR